MRTSFALAAAAAALLGSCSGNEASVESKCPARGRFIPADATTPPRCRVELQCAGERTLALECSTPEGGAALECTCVENETAGKSVPYEQVYCGPSDPSAIAAEVDDAVNAMVAACGFRVD